MRVRVLGGLAVDGIAERDLGSRKGRTLLKVLALARGAPVSPGALAEVLWGDYQPARPAEQVGVLVSRLRGVVGADRLPRTDAGYSLRADWLDVDDVASLGAAAAAALAEGKVGAARAAAEAALQLARGPLLPDEDGLWVEAERAAADAAVARARSVAIDAAVAAGDFGGAAALGEAALARDPYDEVALRALMRAHLAAGRPASALAAYAGVRSRLVEDLGVSPTPETEALYSTALTADEAGAATPAAGPGAPAAGPGGFVGRAAELAALDQALAQAAGGGTALVAVEGEAGIGKSALVDHWSRQVAGRGVVVLEGRCDELGRDLPLQPVSDALAEHLRAAGSERAAAIVGPDANALAPLLGPVAGPSATVVADAETGQAALFSALAAAVARCHPGAPLVLVVEDLHRAGPSTRAWLAFARHRCPATVFVVTSRRPETAPLAPTATLRPGPLSVEEAAELVGREQAEALHGRTGGHPLLLVALAGGGADLQEAVALRVDALGPEAAATLRVAAVLGPDCDLDLVAQVSQQHAVTVLGHLEAAAAAGLLAERGGGFSFRHGLVRDALDAGAGPARRALVHRQAAAALAARPGHDAMRVAVHAREGGDARLAASAYVEAARAAAARFDLATAEDHLGTALELDETADAYVARARTRMSASALAAAAEDAARAVALGGGPAALEVAGWVAYYQRRYREARACADEVVEVATDPAVRASAVALAGRTRHGAGDLQGAAEVLATPVDGAPAAVRHVADVWLAHVRNHQGRPDDALAALAGAAMAPDALAHPWAPLHLRFARAMALGYLGRVAEALAAADELSAALDRAGPVGARFAGPAANVRAWILRWSGRAEEADEANSAAVALTGGDGNGPRADTMAEAHYVALLDLADGCLLRGDPGAAAALAERLAPLASWAGTMAWHQRHRYGLLRARLALLDGDQTAAAAAAAEVAADAASRRAGRYELLATAVAGLADPGVPSERLADVVAGLGRCAGLDGWPLVAALGAARGVEAWTAAADAMVARLAASSGDGGDGPRRLARQVMAARPARG